MSSHRSTMESLYLIGREKILQIMMNDPNKAYTPSELQAGTKSVLHLSRNLPILLENNLIQEIPVSNASLSSDSVVEKAYKITPSGKANVVTECKKEIRKKILKSYQREYSFESISEDIKYSKFPKLAIGRAIEELCKEKFLRIIRTGIFAQTEETLQRRGRKTGLTGDSLLLTDWEMNVIKGVGAAEISKHTISVLDDTYLSQTHFDELAPQLISRKFLNLIKISAPANSSEEKTVYILTKKGKEVYAYIYAKAHPKQYTPAEYRALLYPKEEQPRYIDIVGTGGQVVDTVEAPNKKETRVLLGAICLFTIIAIVVFAILTF